MTSLSAFIYCRFCLCLFAFFNEIILSSDYTYELVKDIADWLLERTELRPKIGIVCGSGLGGLGDRLTNAKIFPYHQVPNFPQSTGRNHILSFSKTKLCCVFLRCLVKR